MRIKSTKQRGITLIALVITIIVLLILAGVSIAMLTGQNGILNQAQNSAQQTEIANAKEQAQMDILEWQSDKLEKGEDATLSDSVIKGILTGKEYVKEAKETSFISKQGEHEILYSVLYNNNSSQENIPSFDENTLEIGEAININKYGAIVPEYTVKTSEMTTDIWRLFYQDSNYTYLITDECIGEYLPKDYIDSFSNGATVSKVGQKLSSMLLSNGTFFTETNTSLSMRATAWLTDTSETGTWSEYKNSDAIFAIGSPTIELYMASFNAAVSETNEILLEVNEDGYITNVEQGQLKTTYCNGIYNKESSTNWWIASPAGEANTSAAELYVFAETHPDGYTGYFANGLVSSYTLAVRPIVCIPTSVFEEKYSLSNE